MANTLARHAADLLKTFHRDVEARTTQAGTEATGVFLMQQQLPLYEQNLQNISTTICATIASKQKEINRRFISIIQAAMEPCYDLCGIEKGMTGAF